MSGPPHNPYYNEEQKRRTFFKKPSTRFIQFNAKNPKGKYVFEHVQDIHTTHASNQQSQPRNVQIETKNESKTKPKNEQPEPPPRASLASQSDLPNEQPEPPPSTPPSTPPSNEQPEQKQNNIKLNPSNEVYEEPVSESTVSESFNSDTSQQRPRSHSVSFDPSVTKKFHRHHHHELGSRHKVTRTQSQAREYPPDPQAQTQKQTQPQNETINETIKATEQPTITPDVDINELKADLKIALTPLINSYIDSKIRYNIEQRLGLMFNNDELTTRGSSSFSISSDSQNSGKSFMFNVNGEPVAKITEDGRLYCKSLTVGGVSIIDLLNDINENFNIIGNDFVTNAQLKDGTYELDVLSIIANIVQLNTVEVGTINGCFIASTTLSSLGTLPLIPVIKSDSIMEIGRYLDFHYNPSDDYTVRLESANNGTLQVTNSKNVIDTMDLFSNNSNRVELHVGQSNASNKCAVLQYNVNPVSLGFGFYSHNDIMNLDPNGNLSVSGKLTTASDATVNGNLSIGGTLTTSSDATIGGELTTTSNASIGGSLTTTLNANISGNITATNANISGNITVTNARVNGTFTAASNAEVQGDLLVDGDIEAHHSIDVLQDVHIGHDLAVVNTASIDNFDNSTKRMILRLMYPVGSVYMSATSHDNPNLIFGVNVGTWVEITGDRYLRSCDLHGTLREEGGSFYHDHTTSNHTLTIDEIPSHYHNILGSKSNTPGSNPSDCVPLMNYGSVSEYWERNNYNNTYIGDTGGGLPHSHGNTGMTMTEPPYYKVRMWYRSA